MGHLSHLSAQTLRVQCIRSTQQALNFWGRRYPSRIAKVQQQQLRTHHRVGNRVHASSSTAASRDEEGEAQQGTQLERFVRTSFGPEVPFLIGFEQEVPLVEDSLVITSELWQAEGRAIYQQSARKWAERQEEDMPEAEFEVLRVSEVGPGEVLVNWQTTWVPPGLLKIVAFARGWPGMEVEKYDILDKYDQISRFKWKGLFMLFYRAFTTGVMRIPAARVKGSTRLTFKAVQEETNRWSLQRHSEVLELASLFRAEKVKNKRIARDLVLFLDVRRPPNLNLGDWGDRVWSDFNISSVPGMGMFDIDGMEDPNDRAQMYEDLTVVLTFVTFITLMLGCSIGWLYFQQIHQEAYLRELLD